MQVKYIVVLVVGLSSHNGYSRSSNQHRGNYYQLYNSIHTCI